MATKSPKKDDRPGGGGSDGPKTGYTVSATGGGKGKKKTAKPKPKSKKK